MKIEIREKKKGMYRVVICIANGRSGCLSTDHKDCEERGNIRAVGFWHRHDDEDLESILSKDADLILDAYRRMDDYSGALVTTEWEEYRK